MITTQLKSYAPLARKAFIAAVSAQAARFGITAQSVEPAHIEGDVLLVAGQAFPRAFADARRRLAERVQAAGFDATMEAVAYTWFNRLVAIRYMELHGYLEHGYRVLSHPAHQGQPEILEHAADVSLPGLDRDDVVALKLDGTQDEALYRRLLIAQCNALNQAMPFLFERVGDETELLLPANLLHTDSLIRQLVQDIDEDTWREIEIIGWLYQFYISQKKAEVIGKVVKSEDIPAATQLFTPNWIVKYMVQNSLGAQWLATYPDSPLRGQMDYYIEPAEQTDEVNAQLAASTPASLDPNALTLIDPACGSGHILVEAYDLFRAIYLERGYRQRDVAKLILTQNLFGLDIDERAAQLTGFALMMKGRADDRRLFERGVQLNVMALVDSGGFDGSRLAEGVKLGGYGLQVGDLEELKRLFEHATTFGSLIQVPDGLAAKLPGLRRLSDESSEDLFVSAALGRLRPLVRQAELLAGRYDAVVANPPYMGNKGMNPLVKKFAKDRFSDAKSDLFACFIERGYTLARDAGHSAMVTMQSWMFLSSFQKMRERMLREKTITTMAHLGARAFGSISGEVVQTTAFVLKARLPGGYRPTFFRLVDGDEEQKRTTLASNQMRFDAATQSELEKIPGSPLAYWLSRTARDVYLRARLLEQVAVPKQGATTSNNQRFLRLWSELAVSKIGLDFPTRGRASSSGKKWFPYNKGGQFRRWYGNQDFVVNFERDGEEIRAFHEVLNRTSPGGRLKNQDCYFKHQLSWSKVSSGSFSIRYFPRGFIFDVAGSALFPDETADMTAIAGMLNSKVSARYLGALSPTLNYEAEHLRVLPYLKVKNAGFDRLVALSRSDWNAYERSWDFQSLPLLTASPDPTPTLASSYTAWTTTNRATTAEMKRLEEENNRLFIDAYGLQDELSPDVPIEQITLTVNPAYRYGIKLTEDERWTRFRGDTMKELISYAIGCMMGRYSLDEPGLIHAHSGNVDFDPGRYPTFAADEDGIVPLTDTAWFDDDATHRLVEFIGVAWEGAHLEDNLEFLAANLSPRKGESPRETLRRYLCTTFFRDHLKTYKKRPIYWLFSSGKQKAFQCLVYLHRYNEGTLSRMRNVYVNPLQGKVAARIKQLDGDIGEATSTAHRRRLEKEKAKLEKQQTELSSFAESLRHLADKRIALDLDDGVKVNYGKFGGLLAEVKAVHGKVAANG